MRRPLAQDSFFSILGFALSRTVLFAVANSILLLALKGFASFSASSANPGGGMFAPFPAHCAVALLMAGGLVVAVVVVTTLLNFAVRPFTSSPSTVTGIAYLVSLVVIAPAQLGAYFFYLGTVDSGLGHFSSYLCYFFLPSLFLLYLSITTAHHIRRLAG